MDSELDLSILSATPSPPQSLYSRSSSPSKLPSGRTRLLQRKKRRASPTSSSTTSSREQRSPSLHPSIKPRAKKQNDKEKVTGIFDLLKKYRWSMKYFLQAMSKYRNAKFCRQRWNELQSHIYETRDGPERFKTKKAWADSLEDDGWKEIHKILRKELLVVAAEIPAFGSFHPTSAEADLNNLEGLGTQLEEKAPRLSNLLFDLCCPPRADLPQNFLPRLVLISSILCFTMQRQKCDNLPTLLGMFLVGAGLKERGANVLNTLGVSKSFRKVRDAEGGIAEIMEKEVGTLGRLPNAIISWDNFEYQEGTRTETIGDHRRFRSITTALLIPGQHIPKEGLKRSMWRPQIIFDPILLLEKIHKQEESAMREV